jgi:propanol-preferring alcohol dehydrogenase
MILKRLGSLQDIPNPLEYSNLPSPAPQPDEVLLRVHVCGVCRTELDEIEGRLPPPSLPVIPGHQAVGTIEQIGKDVTNWKIGERVGVAWIYSACGKCHACQRGEENLCPFFRATGKDVHGGYAEFMTVPAAFVHPIPDIFHDAEAAPLLCAGAIGLRSLRLTGLEDGQHLGLTGFGASAHLVMQLARHMYPSSNVFVFARSAEERRFARELGAVWTGNMTESAPETLHAIIDTTPAWMPVMMAMENLAPGGRLIINAIRKEEADKTSLLQLDYPKHLWLEKEIKSVANVTRFDVREFLHLAAEIPIKAEVEEYPLKDANRALLELKNKHIRGAKVLRVKE